MDNSIVKSFQDMVYEKPSLTQERAVCAFVDGKDKFVILPTGRGKSLGFHRKNSAVMRTQMEFR